MSEDLEQTLLEFFAEAEGASRSFHVRSKAYSLTGPVVGVGADFIIFNEVTERCDRNVVIPLRKIYYAYEEVGE